MHGTTMVFLALMPLSAAFFNYIIPLQIGARDVAFPRLNAFSYWLFLLGGLFINASFLAGPLFAPTGCPSRPMPAGLATPTSRRGSFRRDPTSTSGCSACRSSGSPRLPRASTHRDDSEHAGARYADVAPSGIHVDDARHTIPRHHRIPVITVALVLLMFDRFLRYAFLPAVGRRRSDSVAALFWMFGHPEVYILILPAMGIVSEVLPTSPGSRCSLHRRRVLGRVIAFLGGACGPPHVLDRAGPDRRFGVRRHDDAHRDPTG